ncbi:MAG: BMP family ABC transporter substrate-binding protein [Clostridiales bacterium]|nr:BMP family ABC transporter substrate-binding protein [Clostridiales bacterium]
MKKFLALILAAMMALSIVCIASAEDMAVAMITDYGDITDQSFNQTTYEACKEYCEANGITFNYFKPAGDSDAERVAAIELAINDGYNVLVMPGYAFGGAISATVGDYEDVIFIGLDISAGDLTLDTIPANLYCAVYQEELCGYMAGYAAVKLGYKHLGFLGGMAVPAVVRYGYGFVQGADAAATAMGLTDVVVEYVYGNQFFGDADITAYMDTWYQTLGVEVVFACGGGIFTSAGEAAAKVGGKVIGVDVDQSFTIDGMYGEGMTVTSAMKGLAPTVKTMLGKVQAGEFEGGKIDNLGLVSADPAENYVQIPETTQYTDAFTADDYAAMVAAMFAGEIVVSNDITVSAVTFGTVSTVNEYGNIK